MNQANKARLTARHINDAYQTVYLKHIRWQLL